MSSAITGFERYGWFSVGDLPKRIDSPILGVS